MARRSFPQDADSEIGLQIAPMVNLMLVLIAAMSVAVGQKTVEGELGIQVPSSVAGKSDGTQKAPIILEIKTDGTVLYNKQVTDDQTNPELPQLRAKLKSLIEIDADQSVIIKPDKESFHQRVIDVLDACSSSQVKKLTFGMK